MKMTKDGVIEDVPVDRLLKYSNAGWTPVNDEAKRDTIRLKPAVKTKATVKTLDEANNKGDE